MVMTIHSLKEESKDTDLLKLQTYSCTPREVKKATKFQDEKPDEPFTPPPSTRKSRASSKKEPATPKTPATVGKATPKTAGGARKARSTTKASGKASRSPSPAVTRSSKKKK